MKYYTIHKEQYLPAEPEAAWAFFSSPLNLAKITPPQLGFVILTEDAGKPIYSGMHIAYSVKPLFGIPVKWVTEIAEVNKPFMFVDKQLKGPYAFWEHSHTFTAVQGGVKMTDVVRYALPLGWLGMVMHTMVVRRKLEQIFNFRETALKQLFGLNKK